MSRPIFPLLLTFFLITFFLISSPRASAQTPPPDPIPVSLSSTGEPGNGDSSSPSISADGRWIAFASDATNLVPDDTNGVTDIFVHDRQTGETTRVSVSTNGEQGNGRSNFPALSGNGRYVAFQSDATNLVPADSNEVPDIFVHDRLTGETKRVSVGLNGEQANDISGSVTISYDGRYLTYDSSASNLVRGDDNGASDIFIFDHGVTGNVIRASVSSEGSEGSNRSYSPTISADGRFVTFVSEADNLVSGDTNNQPDIFVYHRVLAQTERVSINSNGNQADLSSSGPDISNSGRDVLFYSRATTLASGGQGGETIFLRDRQTGITHLLEALPPDIGELHMAFSDNGQYLFYLAMKPIDAGEWVWKNIQTGEVRQIFSGGVGDWQIDISADGQIVVFGIVNEYISPNQINVVELGISNISSYFLSGRVTDPLGHPLALVTVTDQLGNSTRTDKNGYFWLAGYAPGSVTLSLEKEGFSIQSSEVSVQLSEDIQDLQFVAFPEKPLEEARLDLGMPYKFDRGCPDPYSGCGGKFHGFTSGFCTDLILDAYTYGADFDIQFDLAQDTYAHPEHFYRWHDARDAHDMWRFFSYSGQMLPHAAPYAPGDIVFFDWSEDGEIDHVALVSEVDTLGRPTKLLDATGKTDYNPTGLAAELSWQEFHERTVRGHARWSGAYQPVIPFPVRPEMLQIAASGGNVNLRLTDASGGALSLTESTLSAGWYTNLIWEESASVEVPTGGEFIAELSNPTGEPAPYRLTIQLVVNGIVIGRVEASGNLPPGASQRIPIQVSGDENGLHLHAFPSRIPKIRGPLTHR